MTLALKADVSGYERGSIRNAISFALTNSAAQARQRVDHYSAACRKFEKKYRMTSEQFARQFDGGSLGDEQDYFDWYAAKRGRDIWCERYEILSKVSL
jgi:hypothetical protein